MIGLRIGPDFQQAVVGSPAYFAAHPPPETPHDLTEHACIGLRLPTSGGLYTWPFAKRDHEVKVRPEGELVFNTITLALAMALAGSGLALLPDDVVAAHVAAGRLVRVLANWCPKVSGYHLYYPSRRQHTPAFTLLVDALRYRQAWDSAARKDAEGGGSWTA